MELWIRSQNREKLIKVNQLGLHDSNILKNDFLLNDKPNYYNISIVANDNYNLGTYITKERALAVLDEIQNVLKPITVFKNAEINKETWEEIQKVGVCAINDRADVIKLDTFVYEMPKE